MSKWNLLQHQAIAGTSLLVVLLGAYLLYTTGNPAALLSGLVALLVNATTEGLLAKNYKELEKRIDDRLTRYTEETGARVDRLEQACEQTKAVIQDFRTDQVRQAARPFSR